MSEVHPLGNTLLRSAETFGKYHDHPKREAEACFICEQSMKDFEEFDLWKVTANEFPYDAVAKEHFMLSPVRHVGTFEELTVSERVQLNQIREFIEVDGFFDAIIENLARGRTFMPHYHLHLIQWKRV